jgi:homoaconitate hydratase
MRTPTTQDNRAGFGRRHAARFRPDTVKLMAALPRSSRGSQDRQGLPVSCVNGRLQDFAAAPGHQDRRSAARRRAVTSRRLGRNRTSGPRTRYWHALVDAGAIDELPPAAAPSIGLGQGLLEAGQVGISATTRNNKAAWAPRRIVYPGQPAVVAPAPYSAFRFPRLAMVAPWTGQADLPPRAWPTSLPAPKSAPAASPQQVEILPGFPTSLAANCSSSLPTTSIPRHLVKDYTYRRVAAGRDGQCRHGQLRPHVPSIAGGRPAGRRLQLSAPARAGSRLPPPR